MENGVKIHSIRLASGDPFIGRLAVLFVCLSMLSRPALPAAQEPDKNVKRAHALELYKQQKQLEALPLFEELAAANPSDALVQEGLGVCLLSHAATMTEPEKRKAEVMRSRSALAKAKELGDGADIVRVLLQMIPENGDLPSFSGHADVDAAMREGEAAFARRDMDAAIASYKRAMLLDPRVYEAPLFIGDAYFQKRDFENAESWYAVAVSVDGNKETAYRYWGDALLYEGKVDEAHAKFIDAVICAPYLQATWVGLNHWALAAGRILSQPHIESPNRMSEEQGKATITIDANALNKNDGSSAWLVYEITRAAWKKSLFQEHFPNEKSYRHSLAEESAALTAVADQAREAQKKDAEHLDPGLKLLIELSDKGLLNAHILLASADEGIAQDYEAYRAGHRKELRQYLNEYVGTQKRQANTPNN